MPVVCDFVEIVGDVPQNITVQVWEENFNTGGREPGSSTRPDRGALLLFNVRGITNSNARVRINNVEVGQISPYPNSNNSYWYTQMIALTGSQLNNGDNEVEIQATTGDPFQIKNMVCFFHQDA